MNCVVYARVSTDKQAEKELSIPAQLQAMREHARRQKWTVIAEYVEPGASAKTAARPVLQEMLARIRSSESQIAVVLVHKIDRLARNVHDHAVIKALLSQRRVRLASVVENTDESVSGQLVENVLAAVAQFFSGNLGEETKKGMRMLVERGGWPHRPPRGYRLVPGTDGRSEIQIDEQEAPAVRDAFKKYSSGRASLTDIRIQLAEQGFRAANGSAISLASAQRLLTNPFYAGRVRWHGAEHQGRQPALVSEQLFRKVQDVIRRRHRDSGEKGKLHFRLRGLAICAECGRRMTAERHGRFAYYRCIRNAACGRECRAPFSNITPIHTQVGELCHRFELPPELRHRIETAVDRLVQERADGHASERKRLTAQRSVLQCKERQLTDAFVSDVLSLDAYRASLSRLRTRLLAADEALARPDAEPERMKQSAAEVLRVAASVGRLHDQLRGKAKADLLRLVFNSLVLDGPHLAGWTLRPPFDQLLNPPDNSDRSQFEDAHVRAAISSIFEFDNSAISFIPKAA